MCIRDSNGSVRERSGSTLTGIVPTNTYLCSDNAYVIIGGNGDSIFKRLMNAMDRKDMAEDSRYSENAGRVEHEKNIDNAISQWTSNLASAEVIRILEDAEVPCGPIYSVKDMLSDPHFNSRNLFEKIKEQPIDYKPKYKPLLDDEALLTFEKEDGIRLSHYNLLVNTNGIQKAIGLKSRTKVFCDLKPRSSAWVIFQVILPIYCGCIFDRSNAEITFGDSKNNYNLRNDINNIPEFAGNDIGICPENTAAICIGNEPIHLTSYSKENTKIKIKGHSVMMGYLNALKNESSFNNEGLFISV